MLEEDLAAYAERAARVLKDITTLQAEPVFAEFRVAVKSSAQVSMRLATIEGSLLACCADDVVEIPIGLVLKPDYPSSPPYCRLKLGPGQRATQHPAITPTAVIKQGAVPALANWATQDEDQRSIINVLLSIADTFGEAMPFEEVDCSAAAASAADLKPQTSLLSSMGSDGGSSPLLPQAPSAAAAANPLRALGGSPTESAQLRVGSELSTGPELEPQASASSSLLSSPLQAAGVEATQPDDAPEAEEPASGGVLGADLGDLATISLEEAEIEAEVAAVEEAVAAAATEPDAEPSPDTTTEALPEPVAEADDVEADDVEADDVQVAETEAEAEADEQTPVEEGNVAATVAAAPEPVAPSVAAEEVEVEVEAAAADASGEAVAAAATAPPPEPQEVAEGAAVAAVGSSGISALFFGGDDEDAEADGAGVDVDACTTEGVEAAVAQEPAASVSDVQRSVVEPAAVSVDDDADADADDAIFYQPDARATEATANTPDMQFLLAGLEHVHEEDLPLPLPAPASEEAPAVAETAEAEAAPVVEATQAEDEEGSTPLHSAARTGRLDTVKFLARECPDLCAAQDGEGNTPLHAAAKAGNLDIVKFLATECPETIAVQDKEGSTPVRAAARCGHRAIVAFLETGECPETEAAPPAALPETLSRLLGLGGDAGGGKGDGGSGGASDPVAQQPTLGYTADGRVDAALRFSDIFAAGDMEEDATPDGRVAKRQLVEAIGERLARDKAVVVQSEEARLNRAAASRESWDLGRDTLRQAVSVLQERRASLLDAIPGVDAAIAEAEQAERSAEEFVDASGEVFLDLIQPDTPLGKQNLELDTSDKAIEDCLYALDQGLKKDIIDAHQYQRLVLDLARRQFECRALQRKIRLKTEGARDGYAFLSSNFYCILLLLRCTAVCHAGLPPPEQCSL